MRVFLSAVMVAASFLASACSSDPQTLRRSSSASNGDSENPLGNKDATDTSGTAKSSQPAQTQAPSAPAPTPTPTPAPSTSTAPATPAPPAAPAALGSCGNPKCAAGGGLSGCKATDSAGNAVAMGCQDGECACFSNNQATTTFESDEQTADDAKNDFLTSCTCN